MTVLRPSVEAPDGIDWRIVASLQDFFRKPINRSPSANRARLVDIDMKFGDVEGADSVIAELGRCFGTPTERARAA